MTPEEREALAADFQYTADRINEAIKADMAPQQMVREANVWLGAAAIVRSHPVASPWIAVGERLPEPDVFVICYHDVYRTLASMGRDGEWREYDGTAIYPTHWMPLPEPPTEPAS